MPVADKWPLLAATNLGMLRQIASLASGHHPSEEAPHPQSARGCLPLGFMSLLVGSAYSIGVSGKGAAAWVNVGTMCTLAGEAAARLHYPDTGRSLENGGCIGDPHIVVERCLVFLCILHYCMAIGCLLAAFIQALGTPQAERRGRSRVLYRRARSGVNLVAAAAPDGEEAPVLYLMWEELGLL